MSQYDEVVQTAREYYNSDDADIFYHTVWGGEDIHIGLYDTPDEDIATASRRTVEHMARRLQNLGKDSYVLDLGAGYGGSMRYLARTFGCRCVALNLSEAENERDRQKNREQGLENLIEVVDDDFTNLHYQDATFDLVWSQDAFLHSGDRAKVIAEAARVLKPGGELLFTDPMQTDDADPATLQPVYDRIHLSSLGSPGFYRQQAAKLGLTEVAFEDHSHQLANHYGKVLAELERMEQQCREAGVSQAYIDRMKTGLGHWINNAKQGNLAWGIFHFHKP